MYFIMKLNEYWVHDKEWSVAPRLECSDLWISMWYHFLSSKQHESGIILYCDRISLTFARERSLAQSTLLNPWPSKPLIKRYSRLFWSMNHTISVSVKHYKSESWHGVEHWSFFNLFSPPHNAFFPCSPRSSCCSLIHCHTSSTTEGGINQGSHQGSQGAPETQGYVYTLCWCRENLIFGNRYPCRMVCQVLLWHLRCNWKGFRPRWNVLQAVHWYRRCKYTFIVQQEVYFYLFQDVEKFGEETALDYLSDALTVSMYMRPFA